MNSVVEVGIVSHRIMRLKLEFKGVMLNVGWGGVLEFKGHVKVKGKW